MIGCMFHNILPLSKECLEIREDVQSECKMFAVMESACLLAGSEIVEEVTGSLCVQGGERL